MKNILKKKNILIISSVLLFVFMLNFGLGERADAAKTGGCTGSSGNLSGYIDTEHVGPVYLSTESWNEAHPSNITDVEFYVDYDRQLGLWSGRGWNTAVGWVDFSYDQINKTVLFEIPPTDPDAWGQWNGEVDLLEVSYSTESGTFEGVGNNAQNDTGGTPSILEDDFIGSGEWTFDHVQFIEVECPQNVNLFLNGTPYFHKSTCPINHNDIDIQWTSENVVEGATACESFEGPWSHQSRPHEYTGTAVHATSDIADIDVFRLRCTGEFTGSEVVGTAVASCGENIIGDPNDPNNPLNIITPILIEA